jgi:hypothetical protein
VKEEGRKPRETKDVEQRAGVLDAGKELDMGQDSR